jgi:mannitol-1-phosphate 5-dehydrogenase
MESIKQNKLVLFGAGRIGRSFIGQLFSTGGYEVVFIDISRQLVDELNRRGNYNVIIKSGIEEVINIKNVRGVFAGDNQNVIHEVATAGIVGVSVGLDGLEKIFSSIAPGLLKRYEINSNYALDIIIAENMRNAARYFHMQLKRLLPQSYPFDKLVGLIETSIGKMVPIMPGKETRKDILQVFAEPYNTLILDKRGFKNPIPPIEGLAPKENMEAWVDRKLFIHNLGHSAAAYIGYLYNPEFIYIYQVLEIPEIFTEVRGIMLQAANILLKKYPDEFTPDDLTTHIDDLLYRFLNKALGDTIFRVGCDLTRKLGPQDRIAGAINSAMELGLPYDRILYALVCGCHFRAKDEDGNAFKGDLDFEKSFRKGLKQVLTKLCGFNERNDSQLIIQAEIIDKHLVRSRIKNAK